MGIIGKNGAGKSTFLHMLQEIEPADCAIRSRWPNLPRRGHSAPQRIRGHPGVRKRVAQFRAGCGQRKSEREAEARRDEAMRKQGFRGHVGDILGSGWRQAIFQITQVAQSQGHRGWRPLFRRVDSSLSQVGPARTIGVQNHRQRGDAGDAIQKGRCSMDPILVELRSGANTFGLVWTGAMKASSSSALTNSKKRCSAQFKMCRGLPKSRA